MTVAPDAAIGRRRLAARRGPSHSAGDGVKCRSLSRQCGYWKSALASATIELADMGSLGDLEKILQTLSPGEKAQILRWVVQDLGGAFPGIDSRVDVCGGDPCIVRTRIPVWLLERARRLGVTEQELLAAYPSLRAEDLVNAWAYACAHAAEIETQIGENEAA